MYFFSLIISLKFSILFSSVICNDAPAVKPTIPRRSTNESITVTNVTRFPTKVTTRVTKTDSMTKLEASNDKKGTIEARQGILIPNNNPWIECEDCGTFKVLDCIFETYSRRDPTEMSNCFCLGTTKTVNSNNLCDKPVNLPLICICGSRRMNF